MTELTREQWKIIEDSLSTLPFPQRRTGKNDSIKGIEEQLADNPEVVFYLSCGQTSDVINEQSAHSIGTYFINRIEDLKND
jgi:hypothetical protein